MSFYVSNNQIFTAHVDLLRGSELQRHIFQLLLSKIVLGLINTYVNRIIRHKPLLKNVWNLVIFFITGKKYFSENFFIQMFIDYKMEKDAEGKDHVLPTKYDFKFDIKDGAHFNMTNLFNGNKDLSKY